MKILRYTFLHTLLILIVYTQAFSNPDSGFFLPDSVREMTLRYRCVKNLIVLPVRINDSVTVNLILDTGCRNLVLFGKKFQKMLTLLNSTKQVQFSGLGSGRPVHGYLSLGNRVSIQKVIGEQIPIVVVPDRNVLSMYKHVDGVVGYEIFLKFEIELNPVLKTITFRPGASANAPAGYAFVPMKIVDSRPLMNSSIQLATDSHRQYDLMIDTGSSLGLLLKTTSMDEFNIEGVEKLIGLGFNGNIFGYNLISDKLTLNGFEMADLPTGIIASPWHNYASIGMEVLKDYVLVLNYCKAYACFKKVNV